MKKTGYLPIIKKNIRYDIQKIETSESMLNILYKAIECKTVERVYINEKYDLIVDEEGLFKDSNTTGIQILSFPDERMRENVFVGNLAIVKKAENKDGEIYWTLFENENEANDLLSTYFEKLRKVDLTHYTF